MNAHTAQPAYKEGYNAYRTGGPPCPYEPGTTARMLWLEGNMDAAEDVTEADILDALDFGRTAEQHLRGGE